MKKLLQHLVIVLVLLLGLQINVQSQDKDLVSFGGHAFTNYFPIELGQAVLYNADFQVIDRAVIDTLGYYYFYQKPQGYYYISVNLAMDDPYFGDFLPTYYPNKFYYEDAQLIEIKENNWELDIVMFKFEDNSNGPGHVDGFLSLGENKIDIEGVDVMVLDENNLPFCHQQTDRLGQFEINDLPFGTYQIYPQIPGFTTEAITVIISDENTSSNGIHFEIKNGQISSGVNESSLVQLLHIFPNPANNLINISYDFQANGSLESRIVDMSGRLISSQTHAAMNSSFTQIATTDLKDGLYLLELLLDGEKIATQKISILH